ncbi:hypothetical protein STA3757_28360 [Stanieria sp. NIES-3757]|nr:hypothetical protein STA3757_28360 [Stanieria sp. NIES-3757]
MKIKIINPNITVSMTEKIGAISALPRRRAIASAVAYPLAKPYSGILSHFTPR